MADLRRCYDSTFASDPLDLRLQKVGDSGVSDPRILAVCDPAVLGFQWNQYRYSTS